MVRRQRGTDKHETASFTAVDMAVYVPACRHSAHDSTPKLRMAAFVKALTFTGQARHHVASDSILHREKTRGNLVLLQDIHVDLQLGMRHRAPTMLVASH